MTLLTLFSCTIACRASPGITIQFPPDNVSVDNEQLNMVIALENQALDGIRVTIGENMPLERPVRLDSPHVCIGVTLNKGLNTIELLGLKQGKVATKNEMHIFFRSDLFPNFREAPANFGRYYFHLKTHEQNCVGCHDMEPTLSSLRPENPAKSTCYTCHKKKYTQDTHIHKPAAQGTCFTCHEVLHGERKYTVQKPDDKVCYPCHNAEVKGWKSKSTMHGPTAVGHCTMCHDPHGSAWPALLRMQTTDLCINCHEDKATGSHVIAGFMGKGHPVRNAKDPFVPNKEFTCAGCHNPHAGNTQNLLNHDNSNTVAYCRNCHKM
ncbi:MAG: hypothetical protein BWK76_11770 [Desulfobulbaceae bacterium A2]|nr:MAG: hypothetical protein BWK76_11770 [Desulfobulbaceae bacterium A2]